MSFLSASRLALSVALLGLLGACTVSSPSPSTQTAPASGLDYANPTGTGWRLMKDATSTSTRLVLNLVGPTGAKGRGVGFNLRAGSQVKFAKFGGTSYLNELGVFKLTNKNGAVTIQGELATNDLGTLVGGIKEGGRVLTVGAYQKDRRWPAQALDQPLFQIALELDPAQAADTPAGTAIPLTFLKARSLPEYIGDNPEDANANRATWYYSYKIDTVTVQVGTLTAK